jgi:hypothetical protein
MQSVPTSVADPGCLSQIPNPDFNHPKPGSQISDPEYNSNERGEGIICSHKYHKIYIILFCKGKEKN